MKEIIVNTTKDKNTIVLTEGMQACFVDIGDCKNAFLHIKDILPKVSNTTGNKNEDLNKYNIKDYVKVGMPVIVEVKKDKTDKKGAKVSANLNIAGKFAVVIPNTEFVTISQKISDKEQIDRLSKIVCDLQIKGYGVIIRTSAINATELQLKEDIDDLIHTYEHIKQQAEELMNSKNFEPTVLFEKGNMIKRLLIDVGHQGLDNVIVNNQMVYNNISVLIKEYQLNVSLKLIEKEDILDIYDLRKQIGKTENRKVWLDCGGFIFIDHTEALTAIDVNTGKFIGKENIEKTVVKVNSEATIEIAKQLRARDIGGIIIIDYIDMDNKGFVIRVSKKR